MSIFSFFFSFCMCVYVIEIYLSVQGDLDLEKGLEMRKWVLSAILASEEVYLSHLEALLLVRAFTECFLCVISWYLIMSILIARFLAPWEISWGSVIAQKVCVNIRAFRFLFKSLWMNLYFKFLSFLYVTFQAHPLDNPFCSDERCIKKLCASVSQPMKPLKAAATTSQPVLSIQQIETIFFKVPELYEIHKEFYDSLLPRVQQWSHHQRVGDLFQKQVSHFASSWIWFWFKVTDSPWDHIISQWSLGDKWKPYSPKPERACFT